MYLLLKRITLFIIPKKLLFASEPFFRSILFLFYKGNLYHCPICKKNLSEFIPLKKDLLCPSCGSLSRTRRLWNLINPDYLKTGTSVLDFSPSRNLYRKFKKTQSINYVSTDLSNHFFADKAYDITHIDCPNNEFDLILCYHILEHVEEDKKAMSELYRVLKNGGHCFIQTPFKKGELYENKNITSEADRLKHFGQEDHVRIYSIKGLQKRLEETGFIVEVKSFHEDSIGRYGYHKDETVLICKK